jgi:NAD(P)-dependent dehydrogenase (short-subunit alcohol dehydrogenase family)
MGTLSQGLKILVTGANSGIGLALTKRLLTEGAEVIALVRTDFPDTDAQLSGALSTGRLRIYRAELQDFPALRSTLQNIRARESKIDVLFNNAGVAAHDLRYSGRGHETHFEVNTVVPYIVMMELKGLLLNGKTRIVINTSSNALLFVKNFDLELLEHPTENKPIIGPYGASKLALSLWTKAVAPILAREGIEIRSVNPGATKTKMTSGKSRLPFVLRLLQKAIMKSPEDGANWLYQAAFGAMPGENGAFIDSGRAKDFKFQRFASSILDRVDGIYRREYLP